MEQIKYLKMERDVKNGAIRLHGGISSGKPSTIDKTLSLGIL